MKVPRRLDPVLDIRLVSLAGGFRQARKFVLQVVVSVLKQAESNADLIVRGYETAGQRPAPPSAWDSSTNGRESSGRSRSKRSELVGTGEIREVNALE
jgi:hypothetical protein